MTRTSQCGFNNHARLTNLIAFYSEVTCAVNKRRAVDVVYFTNTFDTVFHFLPVTTLVKYGLGKWVVWSVENWLDGWAQRMVMSGAKLIRLASSVVLQASVVGPALHSAFVNGLDDEMECAE